MDLSLYPFDFTLHRDAFIVGNLIVYPTLTGSTFIYWIREQPSSLPKGDDAVLFSCQNWFVCLFVLGWVVFFWGGGGLLGIFVPLENFSLI